ncbi:hypothetical protein AB0M20_20685 [Actinoplanes sp. NPDC051633]|uniref:hypothetical protein n=1 Tax=Actinoplanes sp. NPDC051633 TaxID=3155670 RepID=UPI00343BBCE1
MYGHLRLWLGTGLVIFGGLWLWDRLRPSADVPGMVATWWPAGLFLFGLLGVLRLLLRKPAAWIPFLIMTVGYVLLLRTTGRLPDKVDLLFWPGLLTVVGVALLIWWWRQRPASPMIGRLTSIAEARRIKWPAPEHERSLAHLVAIMSGCEVQLTPASGKTAEARLEITAIGSGVEVVIPTGWKVALHKREILGRCRDLPDPDESTTSPVLTVKALAIGASVDLVRP